MKSELRELGLTEREIEVYLCLLRTGPSVVGKIAEITALRRSTVYELLQSLKRKGIAQVTIKNKILTYCVINSQGFFKILEQKKLLLQQISSELNAITNPQTLQIEMLEGKVAIKSATLEMLSAKEIFVYGAGVEGDRLFGSFTENFAKRRLDKNIKLHAVLGSIVPSHMLDSSIQKITYIKTIKQFEKAKTAIFIYGEVVLTIILGDPLIAFRVKNKEYATFQKNLFRNF